MLDQKGETSWKTFVANRGQEIHNLLDPTSFYHVPGTNNPADLLSRGIPASELSSQSLYFTGLEWLKESESKWPITKKIQESHPDCLNEMKSTESVIVNKVEEDPIIANLRNVAKLFVW